MALLEKDGESMKYMNIEKELSHDSNNGETPIINRKRSKGFILCHVLMPSWDNFWTLSDQNSFPNPKIIISSGTAVWESKQDDANSDALNSKIKRLEMDNLHFKTQTEQLKNHNAKVFPWDFMAD